MPVSRACRSGLMGGEWIKLPKLRVLIEETRPLTNIKEPNIWNKGSRFFWRV